MVGSTEPARGRAGPAGPARIRVVVADSHPLMGQAVRRLVEASGDIAVVGEVDQGGRVVAVARELGPDVMLLSADLPRVSCAEVVRVLRREVSSVRIVVLAGQGTARALELLRLGVRGYLCGPSAMQDLPSLIRSVHAGHLAIDPTVVPLLSGRGGTPSGLAPTARELEVLQLVAEGCRNRDIARRLGVTEPTVEYHLQRLQDKLAASCRAELVHLGHRQGWLA